MTSAPVSAPERGRAAGAGTIRELWLNGLAERRATPAYLEETSAGWQPIAWDEAAQRVDELANGLLARGVRKGDAVAILARTGLEWVLLDWAVSSIGAIVVGLYPTSSARECAYILEHSEAAVLFVEDAEQLAKIDEVRGELTQLRDVRTFGDLDALAEEGRELAARTPDALDRAAAQVEPDDLAQLIYTSGTTGPPKGCMLTHANWVAAATMADRTLTRPDDVILLFLPLAHSYGQLIHHAAAYHGFTTAFCAEPTRVAEALQFVRPTVLPAVPRVYEKIHAGVQAQLAEQTGAKGRVVHWATGVGTRASKLRQEGKRLPPLLALQLRLADGLVYSKVKERLGGRLRIGISGAAPLAREVLEFFHALDVLVVEGYGLTETGGSCSVNHPEHVKFGTVGQALSGEEVRLADDGEILIRGANVFTGYYKDDEATRAALTDDGWLRTGDVGELDEDGFLKITDRKKDLIITAGGKNIAPQNLENALKSHPEISQALVVGDRRPYITALLTLDPDATGDTTPGQLHARVQEIVDRVNADLARVEQIKRFVILGRDFSQEAGEVTPTMKLKRRVVHEHFADEIESLYR